MKRDHNGENNPNSKLTKEDVLMIRNRKYGISELVNILKKKGIIMSEKYLKKIRYGEKWKNI